MGAYMAAQGLTPELVLCSPAARARGPLVIAFVEDSRDIRELTQELITRRVDAVAYETVQLDDGRLPLLAPMSEIAGRLAAQAGATFLERPLGGRGLLLGGVPGVAPGEVVVIGGGMVGYNAAVIALGLGATVTIDLGGEVAVQALPCPFGGEAVGDGAPPVERNLPVPGAADLGRQAGAAGRVAFRRGSARAGRGEERRDGEQDE